jgi:endonuclease/exonuclease/phosphatase family metal-dependent hydrolase
VPLRALTWNLMHGRAVPPAGRDLFEEFAAALAGWEWDVALLQEVPPWWPDELAVRLGAEARSVLTSRNAALWVRRAMAVRWPDLIKSNGGGCNAILVRELGVEEHRVRRLGWWPERRWMHAVRLGRLGRVGELGDGVWVGNLHTDADALQGRAAAAALRSWAGRTPALLGGDFNVAEPELPGFARAGGQGVDQVYVTGDGAAVARVLERGSLSDHAPVLVSVV